MMMMMMMNFILRSFNRWQNKRKRWRISTNFKPRNHTTIPTHGANNGR